MMKKIKTKEMNVLEFVEDLEEIILRLHVQLRGWEEKYDQFQKKPLIKNRKEWEDMRRRYIYYQGKFYAYYYVLEKLGSYVPATLQKLRGISMTGNEGWETRVHYSEIYGHFPSVFALRKNKVVK